MIIFDKNLYVSLTLQKKKPYFTKIALKPLHTNLFNIVLLSFFLTIGSSSVYAQELKQKPLDIPVNKENLQTEINVNDLIKVSDTIKKDSIKPKKEIIEGQINRKAVDYEKIDQKKKQLTLYNKAELYYKDIELKAGIIVLDYGKDEVNAGRIKDSTGKYTQFPKFKQGANVIEPDSIRFNFKTKKALVWNSRTEQNDFRIKASITKKENDSIYFMKGARFTTSKDVDNPEYYFQTKIKMLS